jgi:site-specific DNA-methyltransferase (adenine-specific)
MQPYFHQGGITIYHGDYRDILPDLRRSGFDLVVTDPPFFLPAEVRQARRTWPRSIGNLGVMGAFFRDAVDLSLPLLRRTGGAYVFSDSTSYAVFLAALYPMFDRTQCIVWDKGKGGLGIGWRHSHELILHGAFSSTEYRDGFRKDVLLRSTVQSADRLHASEKPAAILGDILSAHPAGVALDPFMGSGSLLEAARAHGWQAIGLDIDEANCEIAARRLEQQTMFSPEPDREPAGSQVDMFAEAAS